MMLEMKESVKKATKLRCQDLSWTSNHKAKRLDSSLVQLLVLTSTANQECSQGSQALRANSSYKGYLANKNSLMIQLIRKVTSSSHRVLLGRVSRINSSQVLKVSSLIQEKAPKSRLQQTTCPACNPETTSNRQRANQPRPTRNRNNTITSS